MSDEAYESKLEIDIDDVDTNGGGWFVYTGSDPRRFADYLQVDESVSIKRLLVANRGEIARRVMRTAAGLGVDTVAIFSDADRGATHVREATLAVAIGGSTSAESYLDISKVLDAARRSGADAVHPGYGFLSENPEFAQAVIDAGLTWVGPSPDSIRQMALKVQAKRIAQAAEVPLVPGAELPDTATDGELVDIAQQVGYPIVVKASAGGGGKGMRVVYDPDSLLEAVKTARREALNSFADSTVFLERYLTGARHVEVQVFGDTHGNIVHLFERECSIQRRHQKIIEECPSPGVTESTRQAMFAAATSLASTINYVGAGTVEFLVFGEGDDQEFFFLEMNTRLQVEHPVTEACTGLDLVEWQLRVADGQELPAQQSDIRRYGHAIEARLYAEDPANDYLPSTGTVSVSSPYSRTFDNRADMSVEAGDRVLPFYDPMIGKIIAMGRTRESAANDLAQWLRGFQFRGVRTNRESLIAILQSEPFIAGETTTDFLDRFPELLSAKAFSPEVFEQFACVAALSVYSRPTVWSGLASPGFRNIPAVPQRLDFASPGYEDISVILEFDSAFTGRVETRVCNAESGWTGRVHGRPFRIEAQDSDFVAVVEFDGLRRTYGISPGADYLVVSDGTSAIAFDILPRFPDANSVAIEGASEAPVPGTVVAIEVATGDEVTEGQTLVVLEAMKMEHRIVAATSGVVTEVPVQVGQSVDAHQVLVVVTPREESNVSA